MAAVWNVLVVDDEEDIHGVTAIALKRKRWRDRSIILKSARSGKEARAILEDPSSPRFHCALVDVVMETNDAGLQLCDFIRATVPRTMRIVLRTGQPGAAPPDKVLNDYDIDYYLAKTEVTEERLYATLRACFRSSLDISAVLAVGAQLRAFTKALQEAATTRESLVAVMVDGLTFLEEKFSAKAAFVDDANARGIVLPGTDAGALKEAVRKAHTEKRAPLTLIAGPELGLAKELFVVLPNSLNTSQRTDAGVGERVKRWFQSIMSESPAEADPYVGVAVHFEREPDARVAKEFSQDLELFLTNWTVAEGSFRLQDKLVRDRMEVLKQFGQGA